MKKGNLKPGYINLTDTYCVINIIDFVKTICYYSLLLGIHNKTINMKRIYFIFIFFFSVFSTYSQTYNADVEDIINDVNLDSLIHYLSDLSGEDSVTVNGERTIIEHRVSNWGNNLAADYLQQTLEGFGLTAVVQNYSGSGKNIYAVQEGTVYPDEYYMICAHYDAVDYYCADDNGSGSSAVLEAARLFSDLAFEYSIIYALWDEEEYGLIGSDYYASQAASNNDVIHAVINMDMISWDGDEDMVVEIHSSMLANSNELADYIVAINDLYDFPLTTTIELPGTNASDHASFWYNGYPSALIIEEYHGGDFNPYYHTENDRIAILNMPYFHEMARLSIGTVASMALPSIETSINEVGQLAGFQLSSYPNPFRNETTIVYTLEKTSQIKMSLMNSLGKEIMVLVDGIKQSGETQFKLHAGDLPSGLYFLYTQISEGTSVYKILIN